MVDVQGWAARRCSSTGVSRQTGFRSCPSLIYGACDTTTTRPAHGILRTLVYLVIYDSG